MDHWHGPGRPFDHFDAVPLLTGSFSDAVTTLHTEVDRALTLAALPWECALRHRFDLDAVRAGVRAHLAGAVAPDALQDVLLVVRELVDNAYKHTDSPGRLQITRRGCTVRVEVSDGTPDHPALRPASSAGIGGQGISLVRLVSRAWGVLPGEGGKTVWAELAAHS